MRIGWRRNLASRASAHVDTAKKNAPLAQGIPMPLSDSWLTGPFPNGPIVMAQFKLQRCSP